MVCVPCREKRHDECAYPVSCPCQHRAPKHGGHAVTSHEYAKLGAVNG